MGPNTRRNTPFLGCFGRFFDNFPFIRIQKTVFRPCGEARYFGENAFDQSVRVHMEDSLLRR
jgi:hypothetical protein